MGRPSHGRRVCHRNDSENAAQPDAPQGMLGGRRLSRRLPQRYTPDRERMLDRLNELWASGVRPQIEATYPLAGAAAAISRLANRDVKGKIVVTMM
nr:zinc-binding dehydrogenase [Tardiphaga sp. OK245]